MTSVTAITDEVGDPDEILTHLYGLTDLDRRVYHELLADGGAMGMEAIASRVDRDRSTVYRSVERLRDADVVTREREPVEGGGYRHVVRARDPEMVATEMENTLNALYAAFMPLTSEFEEQYSDPVVEAESNPAVAD